MNKDAQHQDAMRLTAEYTQFLSRQERMMERMLEKKLTQMKPWIEQMIAQRIKEHLAEPSTR